MEAYIGKSNYTADPLYQGKFKDFRVYGRELGKSEITEVMSQGHSEDIGQYSMDIDGEKVTKELSADLYGLFMRISTVRLTGASILRWSRTIRLKTRMFKEEVTPAILHNMVMRRSETISFIGTCLRRLHLK